MEEIKEFLLKNNYIIDADENIISGTNYILNIMVFKTENGYLIRNAIQCYFDRWANSGCEFEVDNKEGVIEYFSDGSCLMDGLSELTNAIVEDCGFKNDNANIIKVIDFLTDLLEEEE